MPQPSWERYILVVEDDPTLLDLYRSTIRAAGYAVVGVDDGLEALKMVQLGKPRAVVLDLGLPRLNGREVSRQLRNNAATQHIPVMIVTGTDTSDLDPGEFACVMQKPIDPNELVDAVRKCTRR
jgi:DNA-binding response OmpR family regulator